MPVVHFNITITFSPTSLSCQQLMRCAASYGGEAAVLHVVRDLESIPTAEYGLPIVTDPCTIMSSPRYQWFARLSQELV